MLRKKGMLKDTSLLKITLILGKTRKLIKYYLSWPKEGYPEALYRFAVKK